LVCLNRRDYAGTTLYRSAELKVLSEGGEEEHALFLAHRGEEISLFLDRLVEVHSLPSPSDDRSEGGLALMGWSLGNVEPISSFATASSLPTKVQDRLKIYLRRLILHEPPTLSIGMSNPPKHYNPLFDPEVPEEQRGVAFAQWISSYFTHGDLSTRNLDHLSYKSPDPSRKASIANMDPAEFGSIVDMAPVTRSEPFLITKFAALFSQQTSKALFDPVTRAYWTGTDIWLLYGDSSPWNVIYPAWEFEKRAKADGQPVKFHVMKDAHHFVVWDEPEKAVDGIIHCLRN